MCKLRTKTSATSRNNFGRQFPESFGLQNYGDFFSDWGERLTEDRIIAVRVEGFVTAS